MREWRWLAIGVAAISVACSQPKTAASVLQGAQTAMGNPSSIRYSGTGMNGFVGQALTAGQEWPRRDLTAYARTIDYDKRASREEMTFAQAVFGGQQQNAEVVGDKAWNIGANGPVPQPAAAEDRQLQIWLTPHGFVKGALAAGNATLEPAAEGDTSSLISFTALGRYKVSGTIDANNMVTRVSTTVANPVVGDMAVVANYSDYKDFAGVKFPTKIAIEQGGFPAWELAISEVAANPGLELPVPDAVATATIPPFR